MEIILPKIKTVKRKENYGEFVIAPLQPGYGITLGNSLRRILLSSLAGAAVKTISIEGVDHEFSTLPGIKEDVIELILAAKKLRIKYNSDDEIELVIKEKGPKIVRAKDIQTPSNAEIANPDLYIATLQKSGELFARLIVDKGVGYVPADEREESDRAIGEIAIDANYAPVEHVSYALGQTRVGGMTNYDRLDLRVTTDGTVDPDAALQQAAKILVKHFNVVAELKAESKEKIDVEVKEKDSKKDNQKKKPAKKIKIARRTLLEEAGLPTRTVNILQSNNIRTIGGLARYNRERLQKMEGLGPKSIDEIIKKLKSWKIG